MVVIAIAMVIAGGVCDVYGIAIAALGMLSFIPLSRVRQYLEMLFTCFALTR